MLRECVVATLKTTKPEFRLRCQSDQVIPQALLDNQSAPAAVQCIAINVAHRGRIEDRNYFLDSRLDIDRFRELVYVLSIYVNHGPDNQPLCYIETPGVATTSPDQAAGGSELSGPKVTRNCLQREALVILAVAPCEHDMQGHATTQELCELQKLVSFVSMPSLRSTRPRHSNAILAPLRPARAKDFGRHRG